MTEPTESAWRLRYDLGWRTLCFGWRAHPGRGTQTSDSPLPRGSLREIGLVSRGARSASACAQAGRQGRLSPSARRLRRLSTRGCYGNAHSSCPFTDRGRRTGGARLTWLSTGSSFRMTGGAHDHRRPLDHLQPQAGSGSGVPSGHPAAPERRCRGRMAHLRPSSGGAGRPSVGKEQHPRVLLHVRGHPGVRGGHGAAGNLLRRDWQHGVGSADADHVAGGGKLGVYQPRHARPRAARPRKPARPPQGGESPASSWRT